MNMQGHILSALREQYENWEELLAKLSEEQIDAPNFDLNWSIKDVINHLWGWQQISMARMDSAALAREPEFPTWITQSGSKWEDDADQTNEVIYQTFHEQAWSQVHQNWKEGFLSFIKSGEAIPEKDLLDGDKYPWLEGYSLAFILVASYDHHQEHFEKLMKWLGNMGDD